MPVCVNHGAWEGEEAGGQHTRKYAWALRTPPILGEELMVAKRTSNELLTLEDHS
jgi:hypothetical protein